MNTKKNKLIALIATIVAIWVLSFLNISVKDVFIRALGGYTKQTTNVTIDSTFIRGKVDTLAVFNHYVETKGIVLNPEPEIKYKYKYLNPITDKEEIIDSTKLYVVGVKDSLIDGNMTIVNKFNGDLATASFRYKPLFPKLIRRVDTLKIKETKTITLSNDRTRIGIGVGVSSLQSISVLGSVTTKKGWQFMYEYSKPLDLKLTPISKDIHSFKIIKNF
jgi:hypothetical protein